MNKHTAGPWKVRDAQKFSGKVWEGEGHPYTIAADDGRLVCKGALNGDNTLANANLIAAAPELLEACKESLKWFGKLAADHDDDYIADAAMKHYAKVEATIARAEGGE